MPLQTLRPTFLVLGLATHPALAQTQNAASNPAPVQARPDIEPTACAPKLALYTGAKGARILVRRSGSGNAADPLRPLTPKPVVVVELVVDGRTAYAAGPNLANLKRAALGEIETDQRVAWQKDDATPPKTLRLVTEDGRAPFGDLAFTRCEDPPAARRAPRTTSDRPAAEQRPQRKLPQGAIPDNTLQLSK